MTTVWQVVQQVSTGLCGCLQVNQLFLFMYVQQHKLQKSWRWKQQLDILQEIVLLSGWLRAADVNTHVVFLQFIHKMTAEGIKKFGDTCAGNQNTTQMGKVYFKVMKILNCQSTTCSATKIRPFIQKKSTRKILPQQQLCIWEELKEVQLFTKTDTQRER